MGRSRCTALHCRWTRGRTRARARARGRGRARVREPEPVHRAALQVPPRGTGRSLPVLLGAVGLVRGRW